MVKQPNYISILTLVWLPWKQKEEKKKKREGAWVITGRIFITPNNLVYSVILKKKKAVIAELTNFPFYQGICFPLLVNLRLEELWNWGAGRRIRAFLLESPLYVFLGGFLSEVLGTGRQISLEWKGWSALLLYYLFWEHL